MMWVTLSSKITIISNEPDTYFSAVARHPSKESLRELIPGQSWEFPRVMLPGQGMEIRTMSRGTADEARHLLEPTDKS
jgi:hypothetical protein